MGETIKMAYEAQYSRGDGIAIGWDAFIKFAGNAVDFLPYLLIPALVLIVYLWIMSIGNRK